MSVANVLAMRAQLQTFANTSTAVVLLAGSVHGNYERLHPVAAFDTPEAALAYLKASALPLPAEGQSLRKTSDGIYRTWRPDSLLWGCNGGDDFVQHGRSSVLALTPMTPWEVHTTGFGFSTEVPHNPAPPTGPVPEFPP